MCLLALLTLATMLAFAACGSPRSAAPVPSSTSLASSSLATPSPVSSPVSDGRAETSLTPVADVRELRRTLSAQEAADYLGDAACGACHRAEATLHKRSRHAQTLRPVSAHEDGSYFQAAQTITDPTLRCTYATTLKQGKCLMTGRNARGLAALPADYVLGSGRNAHTFLSRDDAKGWVELRLSYYPKARAWDYTPTQMPGTQLSRAAGRVQTNAMLTSCLLCHTTVLRAAPPSASSVRTTYFDNNAASNSAANSNAENTAQDTPLPDLAASRLGVGCERCHGPGRAHVALVMQAQAGKPNGLYAAHDLARRAPDGMVYGMEDLHRATPDRINAICGYCHRTEANVSAGDPHTEISLARFQGVALARSACYQKSGALSCLTCHDAHANANPSLSRNDAICLRCHAGGKQATGNRQQTPPVLSATNAQTQAGDGTQGAPNRIVAGKVCPVNAHTGCTNCHMPRQTISDIPRAVYTNHWIKVWRDKPSSGTPTIRAGKL